MPAVEPLSGFSMRSEARAPCFFSSACQHPAGSQQPRGNIPEQLPGSADEIIVSIQQKICVDAGPHVRMGDWKISPSPILLHSRPHYLLAASSAAAACRADQHGISSNDAAACTRQTSQRHIWDSCKTQKWGKCNMQHKRCTCK